MKTKKMKLDLGKLTIVNLDSQTQQNVKGGSAFTNDCTAGTYCCTIGTMCCTVNAFTCLPSPEGCDPTYIPGQSTMCP
jgi:hypothetical protein